MQSHSTRNGWASPAKLFSLYPVHIVDYVIDKVSLFLLLAKNPWDKFMLHL